MQNTTQGKKIALFSSVSLSQCI